MYKSSPSDLLSKDSNAQLHSVSQESSSKNQEADVKEANYIKILPLYRAVDSGDLETTKRFLEDHPDALNGSLSEDGDTALHIAVLAGRVKVVEELVKRIDEKDLAIKNKNGATALNFAAIGGITKIAEYLVRKSPELLIITNQYGRIPVVVASLYGHKDMVRYLYSVTPMEELNPERSKNGAMLITTCIALELYDVALDLIQRYRELAFIQDEDEDRAMDMLVRKPSAFPSGTHLAIWQKFIYSRIQVRHPIPIAYINNYPEDIETPGIESPAGCRNVISRVLNLLMHRVRKSLEHFVPALKHIYQLKCTHVQCQELLSCICREISTRGEPQFEATGVKRVLFEAVRHGIIEIIAEFMKHYPDIIWCYDDYDRNIFLYATLQRQEKIFGLIYTMGAKKYSVATSWDKFHDNMLHQAAYLASSSQLDRVSGAALQMQRELQWFQEVESIIVQPKYRLMVNLQHKTPQALFTDQHKKLVQEGERWMKETAESCTIVAALIVTIMFTAAFTVPGGYDQNTGIPLYLHRNSFLVFIISDAVSLLSACTSLLMLIGILTTARYREEDFLKSLPTKLIIGLFSLFFSIATMMITFATVLVIILHERISWVEIPIAVLASFPATLYALLYFPLLVEMYLSTYGPGIFDKPKNL